MGISVLMSKLNPVATGVLAWRWPWRWCAPWSRVGAGLPTARPARFRRLWRGRPYSLSRVLPRSGASTPMRRYEASVQWVNLTGGPVTVNGCHSACTCPSIADDLPLALPAGVRRRVSLVVAPTRPRARRDGGMTSRRAGSGKSSRLAAMARWLVRRRFERRRLRARKSLQEKAFLARLDRTRPAHAAWAHLAQPVPGPRVSGSPKQRSVLTCLDQPARTARQGEARTASRGRRVWEGRGTSGSVSE
jgi:hypothetical protein